LYNSFFTRLKILILVKPLACDIKRPKIVTIIPAIFNRVSGSLSIKKAKVAVTTGTKLVKTTALVIPSFLIPSTKKRKARAEAKIDK
jgi:hypothetical protein